MTMGPEVDIKYIPHGVSLADSNQFSADQYIKNTYGLIVGHLSKETVSIGDGSTDLVPEVQVLGTGQVDSSILLAAFSTTATAAGAPLLAFAKGGNATIGSHTVVTDGEELGNIIAFGDDGTDIEAPAAMISFEVDGTPGTGDMPGRILFATSADGGETLAEHLRISAAGLVTITRGDAGAVPTILDANSGTGQTSSTSETTLYTYTLPANTLVNNHDAVFYHASGTFAANTNNKTLTAYFGATTLGTTGAQAYNGVAWDVTVMAYMAAAGNQRIITTISVNGVVQDIEYDSPSSVNDETGTIVLAIKGTAANTATGEIVKRLAYTELRQVPA